MWEEKWDEFNDVPVWVHPTKKRSWGKPVLGEPPLLPICLSQPLNTQNLERDEASSDDDCIDVSTFSNTEFGSSVNTNDNSINDDSSLQSKVGFLRSRDEELELAASRVLEIRRRQLVSRYF